MSGRLLAVLIFLMNFFAILAVLLIVSALTWVPLVWR